MVMTPIEEWLRCYLDISNGTSDMPNNGISPVMRKKDIHNTLLASANIMRHIWL